MLVISLKNFPFNPPPNILKFHLNISKSKNKCKKYVFFIDKISLMSKEIILQKNKSVMHKKKPIDIEGGGRAFFLEFL